MATERFLTLDVMRGLTLALMILVNTPGSWNAIYWPLAHADWHGVTPTDFVFPFFLFIVGAALNFSTKGLAQLNKFDQSKKIARRVGLLFLIGVLLSAFPFTAPLGEWRVLGVLQRIALAYGCAIFMVLYLGFATRMLISIALLVGYWALLNLVDDPYSLEHNLVRQIDLALFGESHLWHGKSIAFDPEGLLSTLPAIVSVLIGYDASRYFLQQLREKKSLKNLFLLANGLIIVSLIWSLWFPINKSLWTSPFVLLTSGFAILILLLLSTIEQSIPSEKNCRAFNALQIMGKNPLFIYVASELIVLVMYLIPIENQSSYSAIYAALCTFADPYLASLLFALGYVALLWGIAWVLHKRNIVIHL